MINREIYTTDPLTRELVKEVGANVNYPEELQYSGIML